MVKEQEELEKKLKEIKTTQEKIEFLKNRIKENISYWDTDYALFALAKIYRKEGEEGKAEKLFSERKRYLDLAETYEFEGKKEKAAYYFEKEVDKEESKANCDFGRAGGLTIKAARMREGSGDLKKACEDYQKAIKIHEEKYKWPTQVACILEEMGDLLSKTDPKKAIENFQKAIDKYEKIGEEDERIKEIKMKIEQLNKK